MNFHGLTQAMPSRNNLHLENESGKINRQEKRNEEEIKVSSLNLSGSMNKENQDIVNWNIIDCRQKNTEIK